MNAKNSTGYINHVDDYINGSNISEMAAEDWIRPQQTIRIGFNPFSGRGRVMAQMAKSKRTNSGSQFHS